jgi:branched-chain amino acid transport system permease protein
MATFLTALGAGSLYALVAIGYNVIYLTTNVFNFAQGAIVAIASLLTFSATATWGLPALVAVIVAAGACLAITVVEYGVAIKPVMSGRSTEITLVSTFGAAVALQAGAQEIWGTQARGVDIGGFNDLVSIGDSRVAVATFVAIGAAVIATLSLDVWYARTRAGRVMRAMAEDREAAEARGIDTSRVALASFALAGAVSGVAGFVLAPVTFARADLGTLLAIKAFVAIAIGGFGSNKGALLGGLAIGLVETYAALWVGVEYQNALVFGLLVAVLLVLPQGIFGSPVGRRV